MNEMKPHIAIVNTTPDIHQPIPQDVSGVDALQALQQIPSSTLTNSSSPSSTPRPNLAAKAFIPRKSAMHHTQAQTHLRSERSFLQSRSEHDGPGPSIRDFAPDLLKIPSRNPVRISAPNSSSHSGSSDVTPGHGLSNSTRSNSPTIQQHSEYYFVDGGVVLQLQNLRFRIHPHLIGRQSEALAKLFADSESAHPQLVDGCKLFVLPGDAKDFESVLGVLYDGFTHISKSQPFSFEFTAQILRASTLHTFPALRLWAINELKKAYPPDLDSFDPEDTSFCEERVALARQCGIGWLAKTALYHVAALKELGIRERDDAWDSDEDEEGDLSISMSQCSCKPSDFDPSLFSSPVKHKCLPSPAGTTLPLTDLQLVIRLLEKFQKHWILIARPPAPLCPEDLDCRHIFASVWSSHVLPSQNLSGSDPRTAIFAAGFYNPLKGFQTLAQIEWERLGVCEDCAGAAREGWKSAKKKIWEGMDRWLHLNPADC